MKTNYEILSGLLKTTQLGQAGIRSVMDSCMGSGLRQVLLGQLREFEAIETEAFSIASQRGWELPELEPAVKFLTDLNLRRKLACRDCDSRIADLMILGNTKGMIRNLKQLHRFPRRDDAVSALSQRLLDCETANILNMQQFL